jgi:hypothetical protein
LVVLFAAVYWLQPAASSGRQLKLFSTFPHQNRCWLSISMRRLRFSLRHLLVLVTILAVVLSFGGKRVVDARKQRQLIAMIQSYGGENHHDLNFKNATERTIRFSNMEFSPTLPGPDWIRRWLGDEYFVSVAEAFFDKSSHRALDDAMFAEFVLQFGRAICRGHAG